MRKDALSMAHVYTWVTLHRMRPNFGLPKFRLYSELANCTPADQSTPICVSTIIFLFTFRALFPSVSHLPLELFRHLLRGKTTTNDHVLNISASHYVNSNLLQILGAQLAKNKHPLHFTFS